MGVHISKVRSLKLDIWEPELVKVMAEIGNKVINQIYEAKVHEIVAKRATKDSDGPQRETWIKAKYLSKAFIDENLLHWEGSWNVRKLRRRKYKDASRRSPGPQDQGSAEVILFGKALSSHQVDGLGTDSDQESTDGEESQTEQDISDPLNPNRLLFRSARVHNLPVMSQALALNADPNWIGGPEGSPVLHQAIFSGSVMACEFLLLNGAKINAVDSKGNSSLHLAATRGNTGQVCLLLKHRANHHLVNGEGKKALDLAVIQSDADIVTLLRLAALNEEIRESDFSGDDTFNDVVHEFSQMVYTQPQRLQRKSEPKS